MPAEAITLSTRIRVSADQVSTNLSGESVILGMKRSVYYGLDAVGTRVWELIHEPHSLGQVADVIAGEFEVSRDVAGADLIAFAKDLVANGLADVVAE